MLDEFSLKGRVALITGGNRGIGRGIALAMARAGAEVVIAARDEERNAAVVQELRGLGARATSVRCDVRNKNDLRAALDHAIATFGKLTIVVNNAGINRPAPPEQLSEEDWDAVLDTNLKSVFLLSQMAYPLLKAAGGGKIINIGSLYSLYGAVHVSAYAASKGGVVQLTRSLAAAWAKDNIQVNCIIPGVVRTELWGGALEGSALAERIQRMTPATRILEGEEIGPTAVYLASRAADLVTGQSIAVDGGLSTADLLQDYVRLRESAARTSRRT